MGYIKDWLAERLNEKPVFQDLYRDVERDPQYFRLLFERDDETIQRFDSPEVKRVKMEIADQRKRGETLKKDIEKMQKKLATVQKLGREKEEKMDDLRLLLESRVKTIGGLYPSGEE